MNLPHELITSGTKGAPKLDEASKDISASLLNARRIAEALPGFPGTLPADLITAYEIQSHSIGKWPDQVAGWKVGGIPHQWREQLGEDRLVGPIFKRSVKTGEAASMPVFEHGFAAIEPEFIIQLGENHALDRMFIGAEIASSPVPAINDHGPIAVVSDFGNNNGVLVGPEIFDWANLDGPLEVSIWIDGVAIAQKTLDDVFAGALVAREFCFEKARQRGMELQPRTLISSGAITGVHEARVGAHSTISFGRLGQIKLQLECAGPMDKGSQ